MNRSDETCLGCGARRDEHDELSGACSRTNCKAFSDAYYAFNENLGGDLKTPKVPMTQPARKSKSKTVFAAYALLAILLIVGIIVWAVLSR